MLLRGVRDHGMELCERRRRAQHVVQVLAALVWSLPGSVALILHVAPAGRLQSRAEPLADVYGLDAHGRPADEQTVEMLRFVTAYGTGIEALVDVTPYSPLLSAGSGSDGLTFYAFIDTWVNNETGVDALYMNNLTQQCTPIVRSYGNGWNLSAELLFWSKPAAQPLKRAKPYHMVTLASGFYGANYALGRISIRTGHLAPSGSAVVLDEAAELDRAASARVYGCQGGASELQYAAQLGFFSQQVEEMVRKNKSTKVDLLINTTFKSFAVSDLVKLTDTVPIEDGTSGIEREARLHNGTHSAGHLLRAKFNTKACTPEKGMPVFLAPGDVFTDQELSPGVWWNLTYPLDPVGRIVAVGNGTLDLLLSIACAPTNHTILGSVVPRLLMARDSKALPILHARLTEAARMGIAAANSSRRSNESTAELRFLRPDTPPLSSGNTSIEKHAALREPHLLGRILTNGSASAVAPSSNEQLLQPNKSSKAAEKICVVEQEEQGTLFQRHFKLPDVASSDRIVLQLTVTGHGWAATTEQCGEYCHAVYLLRLNGQLARNVSQFRNDCKDNPIGVDGTQHGTWWESRNGWCPGTVEPGTFMDVTKWLHPGDNRLEMEVLVWNELHSKYESYIDYSGFAFDDAANLVVGLNLFVYDAAAAAAARATALPGSAAEEALKTGTGGTGFVDMDFQPITAEAPVQLMQLRRGLVQPHSHVMSDLSEEVGVGQNLTQSRAELFRSRAMSLALRRRASPLLAPPAIRLRGRSGGASGSSWAAAEAPGPDFESSTPWYLYNSSNVTSEQLASQAEAVRVPVISTALMQGARRNVAFHVEASAIPKRWSQVALHFRLAKPGGALQYDRWDRLGSFGLRLDQAASRVKQFAEPPPAPKTLWTMES